VSFKYSILWNVFVLVKDLIVNPIQKYHDQQFWRNWYFTLEAWQL